jgi:hypothetical protein
MLSRGFTSCKGILLLLWGLICVDSTAAAQDGRSIARKLYNGSTLLWSCGLLDCTAPEACCTWWVHTLLTRTCRMLKEPPHLSVKDRGTKARYLCMKYSMSQSKHHCRNRSSPFEVDSHRDGKRQDTRCFHIAALYIFQKRDAASVMQPAVPSMLEQALTRPHLSIISY